MKNNGVIISLIVLLSIISIILISIMVLAIVNKDKGLKISFFTFGDKTKLILQKEYDINDVNNISISDSSYNVKFIEGDADKVKVTIYGLEDEKFNVDLTQNELKISRKSNNFHMFVFFAWNREEIIVELPKQYDGNVRNKIIEW